MICFSGLLNIFKEYMFPSCLSQWTAGLTPLTGEYREIYILFLRPRYMIYQTGGNRQTPAYV